MAGSLLPCKLPRHRLCLTADVLGYDFHSDLLQSADLSVAHAGHVLRPPLASARTASACRVSVFSRAHFSVCHFFSTFKRGRGLQGFACAHPLRTLLCASLMMTIRTLTRENNTTTYPLLLWGTSPSAPPP